MISEIAYAKINLGLKVLGKRADGYHEVDMLMQSIALADTLEFQTAPDLLLRTDSSELNADGQENLIIRAAKVLQKHTGYVGGAHITLHKKIPIAAGLAGGSSDAAATLRGLNRLWGLQLSMERLEQLATQIGSDVAFCVRGGTKRATGRGELLSEVTALPPTWLVLYKPEFGVSTAQVYGNLNLQELHKNFSMEELLKGLKTGLLGNMFAHMHNDLETATLKIHPIIEEIKKFMVGHGAEYALMSGSGPSIFAVLSSEQGAKQMAQYLEQVYRGRAFVTRTL